MKKLKFIGLITLLLFARGCDFYSTSLWIFQENGLEQEMNLLTQVFGVGWNGLIIANAIVCLIIVYLHYRYTFLYEADILSKTNIKSPLEYASQLYFGNINSKLKLLYSFPKDKRILVAHSGYVLIRLVIIVSLIATVHNLNQYHHWGLYDGLTNRFVRPLYIIYFSFLLSYLLLIYRLWRKEYNLYISNVTVRKPDL